MEEELSLGMTKPVRWSSAEIFHFNWSPSTIQGRMTAGSKVSKLPVEEA